MEHNYEIEFKNMLTEDEYQKFLTRFFPNSSDTKHMTIQTNHYFDTIAQVLKKQHSALRIRTTDSYRELTLKVPHNDFLMETNIPLSPEHVSEILNAKQIRLSSYLSKKDLFQSLDEVTEDTIFHLFNSFRTKRFEKQVSEHLIVLDQTTFQNGIVDYELEVESTDAVKGKDFFESFLNEHSIPNRPASPKIARSAKNGQPLS